MHNTYSELGAKLRAKLGYNDALMCFIEKIAYVPSARVGGLFMRAGHCCDMTGCLILFLDSFPEIQVICTFSGEETDTAYVKVGGKDWVAVRSNEIGDSRILLAKSFDEQQGVIVWSRRIRRS